MSADILLAEIAISEARAVAAEEKVRIVEADAERKLMQAQSDAERRLLASMSETYAANARADAADAALNVERAARIEAEARCTILISEVKRPHLASAPKGWKLTFDKDAADNTRAIRIEAEQ